jgi:3'-phosphoadenosine 5'-phosphosulfate sulfotransferase (PAPS reductase)/FAD synthetase
MTADIAAEARRMIREAVVKHDPVGVWALFSGGHDSLTSTALAAADPAFLGAVHINTGIGIEETREFVRETCQRQRWPLHELHSEAVYEDLVLERGGFPSGPKAHSSMYWHLKQRPLRRFVREAKAGGRQPVMLVAGIRVHESLRRMNAGISVPVRRDDRGVVWVNPILEWQGIDCSRFIDEAGLQRNVVVDTLHRSGECLCGALARAEEIHEIDAWYPDTAARIHALEERARAAGLKHTKWASAKAWGTSEQVTLPMCVGCELRGVTP